MVGLQPADLAPPQPPGDVVAGRGAAGRVEELADLVMQDRRVAVAGEVLPQPGAQVTGVADVDHHATVEHQVHAGRGRRVGDDRHRVRAGRRELGE
ncbi:hypothetical protein DQE82_02840 [Micromonospora sp. LHW51205]|nr:hypothetical protein DQE82_02840 [Micromonospora sp. LHW51205]